MAQDSIPPGFVKFTGELDPPAESNVPPGFVPFTGKLDAPAGGLASDLAKSLKAGTQRLPGMVTGLADLPFALAAGARPFTKAADALGEVTGFQPGKWADETKFSAGYDQGKKAVDDAWKDGSAGDIALAYLKNPGYTANQVAESLPSMVAGGLAGRALMGLGRVAPVAAKAGGVGPVAPGLAERALGQWAAPVAGGVGEGAVTAGQQMQQYKGDDQQKNALASLGAGVVTGGLGVGAGRVANKLGLETAETAIAKAGTGAAKAADDVPLSAKRRILGGMVSEALLQELPQSAQEQMWQNWADGKPLMDGVARAATEGAIAGGVMGAGANVSDGGAGKRRALAEQQAKLLAEAEADALRADPSRAWTTELGATDPNQPVMDRAVPPVAPELQTSPGAAGLREGLDFTRDVDTTGLTLEDPAEVERARAATMDYEPTDATPQWNTTRGAAQDRQPGLDMPAPEFDTGALGLESRSRALTPSQQMGINPAAGPLSKLAAPAVDSGLAQQVPNAQAATPQAAPAATTVSAAGTAAVEAVGAGGEFSDLFDEQGRSKFSGSASVKEFKKRTGLGQDGVRAIQAAVQDGRPITLDEARQSDIAGQERRSASLEQAKAASEAESRMAKENAAKPAEQRKLLGDYEIPGLEGAISRVRVFQQGTRIEAVGISDKTANHDLSGLIQIGKTVEQALAALYGDHAPNEAPNHSRVKRIGQPNQAKQSSAQPAQTGAVQAGQPAAPNAGGQVATPTNLREGLANIRAQKQQEAAQAGTAAGTAAGEAAGPATIPATTGVARESQASQTQQGSTQSTQAGGPQAGAATATASASPAGGNRVQAAGLTNGAPTQNTGAQAATAAGAQGQAPQTAVARPDGWRKSMLKAGPVAKTIGIDPKGKRLAQVVAEIDAADAQRATEPPSAANASGANQPNSTSLAALHEANGPYQPSAATRIGDGQWLPAVKTGPDSGQPIAGAPTFSDAGSAAAWAGYEQAKGRAGADVAALQRLQDFIDGRQQPIGETDAAPRNLRLADERAPGAAAPAQDGAGPAAGGAAPSVGAGQRAGADSAKPAPAVRAAVPDAGGTGKQGSGVAPTDPSQSANSRSASEKLGREVSREIGKYKQGMSEHRANEVRAELARKNPEVIYSVEEDASLKNGFVVVGRKPAPGAKLGVEKLKASKGRAPLQFSRGLRKATDFVPNADGGLDYGEITPEMGKAMRRQAGVIRLQQGVQNQDGTGYGLRHIEANHGKQILGMGYKNVQEFVAHVASGIQQVWQVPGNSQLLVTVKDGRKDVMYIQLEIAKEGDFYRVNSAFPVRQQDYEALHGLKKIWDGSEPTSAVTGQRPAFATAASASPDSESSQGSSNARGQNSSVPPSPESAKFSQAMSPELARALLAIRRPATKESVRAAVRELVNGLGLLPNRLGRVVVATAAEIQQEWEPLIGPVQLHAEQGGDGAAQGFYDPNTRTVFLIADHIRQGDELGVVAHELMHKHGQAVLGEDGWNRLHGAIDGWAGAPEGSQERRVYDEAAARVRQSRPADAAAQEYSSQELFPYAVQVALEQGVRPNLLAKPGTVARWLGQVKAALRDVWSKIVGKPESFNAQDLVNLAFGIAQRENPEHARELDGAVQGGARGNVLQELAATDALFRVPKSSATTVEGIAEDIGKDINVRKVQGIPGRQEYEITMPSGDKATLSVRSPNPYGESVYGFDLEDGEMANMELERPGDNPQDVPRDVEDVWIDASRLSGQGDGMLLYALAANYAYNTGRIFIGDPAGLSDQALRRRSEQMLSSALKFGTTAHLAPHPRQVRGDSRLGVPPLKWVYGDDLGNIRRLVDLNLKAMENAGESSITYDPEHGTYLDSNGTPIDRDGISILADSGYGRNAGAGSTTLARRAVLDSLLRATSEKGRGEDGRPDALLEILLGQSHRHPAATERLFYSRSVAATPAAGDYTPEQRRASERAFGVQKKQTWTERAQSFRANLGTKLRQGLVDQFAPLKEVSDKAYMLARMSKGSDGAVEAALLYGKPFLRDGVYDVDIKDGGFAKVLATLNGEHDRFFQWVAAQRAERLKAEGKENLLTDQDITALRTLNAGRMADGTARMPVYAAALRELNAFNEATLKVAMESGLIDQAAFELMKDQPYVPFYRLMEEDGGMRGPRFSSGLVNQQAWKKLKGGTQQMNADLLQNTLMNWSHLYGAAARNRASLETMAAAEKMGIAYQVPAETKGAVKVMRDGVAEHWAVEDPYLLDAISAMSYAPGGIVKAMAPFKRLLTFGVTVNPTFKIRNLIRDSLSAIAQSDLSYNPLENVAKGWIATGKESQTYASMLASGGIIKFGTQEDSGRVRAQIEKLGGRVLDQDGWGKLKGQMRTLWETYEEFGDRTENVNRAALYERLVAKGHSHAEASFMARDLMDFSMSGKWEVVRFLTQTVPFLNARMQGLYKLGRAAKEDPRRFAAMAGAVSLASLGLMAAYGDDDDWKKREDWDRDNYWWFKIGDMAFRIPKPFEVGAIGTVAERTAELMFDKEMTGKRFGQRISDMVFNTFAMDPTPQLIKPFIDIYANKDSFSGRPIEGMADERLRPQDRYNERTSEVARLLGSWGLPDPVRLAKGEYSGLSPKQIDFLLRGYFGWLATVATTATDTAARPMLDRGERPAMRLRDTFLAGNFVETLPTGSSRYVSSMYEQAKEIEQAWASYQAALKSGDMEKAREIQQDEAPKLRNRMAVEHAKRQITELGQQAKRIESNRLMPAEEKRRRLDELEARKHEAARRVAPTS